MQHTEQLTQSALSNSSTLLTPRYVSIYKPISKLNINIIHHGIYSDIFFSGVTINCDNKLLFIAINGKFKQLHLLKMYIYYYYSKSWIGREKVIFEFVIFKIIPAAYLWGFSRFFFKYILGFCKWTNFVTLIYCVVYNLLYFN
jgi:hypothetical protein